MPVQCPVPDRDLPDRDPEKNIQKDRGALKSSGKALREAFLLPNVILLRPDSQGIVYLTETFS